MNVYLLYGLFIVLLFVTGIYYIVVTRNIIRVLVGVEVLAKAVTIAIVVAGSATNRMALAQSFAITVIIVEVVIIAVAAGIAVNIYRKNDSLDADTIKKLKG